MATNVNIKSTRSCSDVNLPNFGSSYSMRPFSLAARPSSFVISDHPSHVIAKLRQSQRTDASSSFIDRIVHTGQSTHSTHPTVEHVCELYIYQHAAARAAKRPLERSPRRDLRPNHQTRGIRCLEERLQRRSSADPHSFRDPPSPDSTTLPAAGGPDRGEWAVADQQADHLHSDREHAEP